MKKCELCKLPATLYCESDQANLCASCDLRVHEANFLVARHSRTLLCKTCQSPTPWVASGARLGNIATECAKCVAGGKEENEGEGADEMCKDGEVFAEVESGEESDESETGASDDEAKECENQVLPYSISPYTTPPPPDASSSSSDESSSSSSSSSSLSLCASRRRSQKRLRHRSSISE